jgi:hypothetical protein
MANRGSWEKIGVNQISDEDYAAISDSTMFTRATRVAGRKPLANPIIKANSSESRIIATSS